MSDQPNTPGPPRTWQDWDDLKTRMLSKNTHWLFRAETFGGHVHVNIWAGTEQQAKQKARPKLGTLIMLPGEWAALKMVFHGAGQVGFRALIEERPAPCLVCPACLNGVRSQCERIPEELRP